MNTITNTVKKGINVAVEIKLSNTISNWAKEEVKTHLEFLTKQKGNHLQTPHPENTVDDSNHSASSSTTLANLKDIKDNFEFLPELVHMPQVTYTSHHSHKKPPTKNANLNTQFHL